MTRAKGSTQEQVTRLRLRAAERLVEEIGNKAGVPPSPEVIEQLRALLTEIAQAPELVEALVEFNRRLGELERALGSGQVVGGDQDGVIKMG